MKTSLEIRDDLWTRAKVLAIKRKTSMKQIIEDALDSYLPKTLVVQVRKLDDALKLLGAKAIKRGGKRSAKE